MEAFVVALQSVWNDSGFSAFTMGHAIMMLVGIIPVSYTHLDVYKRQVQQNDANKHHDSITHGESGETAVIPYGL